MCKPTTIESKETRRVVVSGAGPAGLLMTSLLLARNKEPGSQVSYEVTLIDTRQDYGSISKEELSKHHRSWMLGLADHGMDAIKTLPDLYQNYVKGEGILVKEFAIYLGSKKMSQTADETTDAPEAFIVDRNFIVAALARYVRETHQKDENFTSLYQSQVQYVDYENKQVLVRDLENKSEQYISYDLLIGCDGKRSTVREALMKCHANFSCDATDIFQEFKATHIERPAALSENAMGLLPGIFPHCQGIALPERGGLLNVSIGVPRNQFELLPEELKSPDYEVVAQYTKDNFKAFDMVDYDDFGKQWVKQRWNQTGMVHCNFYHSVPASVVIMGDSAHATSPSIGMGMNTALRDAQIFSEILRENKDDLSKALPAFSEARVKEGNALSDLAMHLYCMDSTQQLKETIHMVVRGFFSARFPRLVQEHAQVMIGRRGVSLSEVYETAVKQGIIRKHMSINNKIRQEYFEKKTGMITDEQKKSPFLSLLVGAIFVSVIAVVYQNLHLFLC